MINLELNDNEKAGLNEEQQEIAKARKLEILILPFLRRNINFFYAGGNLKGKAKAYREKINKNKFEEIIKTGNKNIATVCKPLCDMVVEILKENGLNADTVSCDTDMFRHIDVVLTTKKGRKYIINYLEDMENVQTGMSTPDFASEEYYKRRYEKFENGLTTDGKSLNGIAFLSENELDKIDTNLGYKKYNMYMDKVIEQIKTEFSNFKDIMAENEWLTKELELDKVGKQVSEEDKEKSKDQIYNRYRSMTAEEEIEAKLDWLFSYFNNREVLKGHADFVMYYSRLLLKKVFSPEEYNKLTRYDCFAYIKDIPDNSKIANVLDFENIESKNKLRFCLVQCGEKTYAFSTKPNEYVKLDKAEIEELRKYANISQSSKPSDLMLNLCDRGNALPLVFHPVGSQILNERADLIDTSLTEEIRKEEIKKLASSIITTDEPITSIKIPYPNGEYKYIYINSNDEVVVRHKNKEIIYHYDEENDSFNLEEVLNEEFINQEK